MDSFDPEAFEIVLGKITDGAMFERFAQDLLCHIKGLDFTPLGGQHDRGLDGLEHCLEARGVARTIYQISIEADPQAKLRKTLAVLAKNGIDCARLFYVTNRRVGKQDELEDSLYADFGVATKCHDVGWLRGNVNANEGTLRVYLTFVEAHYHQFRDPGSTPILADFDTDPRLFVFLRQQWEGSGGSARLDHILTDTLILLALEGTDPDLGRLLDRTEVLSNIQSRAGFNVRIVEQLLDQRLDVLSNKPRRINHHRHLNKYCLPYQTRIEIQDKNIKDAALHETFVASMRARLARALAAESVIVQSPDELFCDVLNKLFKQQGLEFAQFLLDAPDATSVEKSLADVVSETVDQSSVIPKNRGNVKTSLLAAMRELVYTGSPEELLYLRKLAQTYMMLFLLKCDPKIATYFSVLAGRLRVFVCNSLLVPAISELPLDEHHRRHWNLLVNAHAAGVSLLIDAVTLHELASHIRNTVQEYSDFYEGRHSAYEDDTAIAYVEKILIRSYLYARKMGEQRSFRAFINQFVTPGGAHMEEELIEWLRSTFGIVYVDEASLGISLPEQELAILGSELQKYKSSKHQAENDARTILAIHQLRARDNERGEAGVFGYRTWWLSKDTVTQRAVRSVLGTKYSSCYMRFDFLYNYIALTPSLAQANSVFDRMFPTLLGVNISHHLSPEVAVAVRNALKDHADLGRARVRGVLRGLTERLATERTMTGQEVTLYLDEQLGSASSSE
jgi:hypothetical protein